jgi:hypothetical protein
MAAGLAADRATVAIAQTWAPSAGEGSVSLAYQTIDNTGHRRTNGFLLPKGRSEDMSFYLELEYAFTNQLSLAAGMPYVLAKYTDPNPPASPIPYLPVDQCHCWHSGLSDLSLTARYNVIGRGRGSFALTPLVAFGTPAQDYNFRGESALGRGLREVRVGFETGWRPGAISRHLSVQGGYTYAFVKKVMGISTNRSNATMEGNYLIKRRLLLRGEVFWQRTHGGLRFGSPSPADLVFPGEVDTPELLDQHDRLLRDNYWHAGGGLVYALAGMDLFAAYTAFVAGTDTHAGHAVTVGFSVPFRLRGTGR